MKRKQPAHISLWTGGLAIVITATTVLWLGGIAVVRALPSGTLVQSYPPPENGIMLPLVVNNWPPVLVAPILHPIANTDQDNIYTVSWEGVEWAEYYTLEESTDAFAGNASVVYQGTALTWSVPSQGKTPATYSYRVSATTSWGISPRSNVQSVAIYPLFVGLRMRWDGVGYIRGDSVYDVGVHTERNLDIMTDADTIRSNSREWYDPGNIDSSSWYAYYSVTTGEWRASSVPDDPSRKWAEDWVLAYGLQFSNGQTVSIDGKRFLVTGPHDGYTAFGEAVQYWEFVNRDKFVFHDNGGDWKEYVHAGDITLRYDAGNTRLLLHYNVLRRYYYRGNLTSNTVQYIDNLTSSSSFLNTSLEIAPVGAHLEEGQSNNVEVARDNGLYR